MALTRTSRKRRNSTTPRDGLGRGSDVDTNDPNHLFDKLNAFATSVGDTEFPPKVPNCPLPVGGGCEICGRRNAALWCHFNSEATPESSTSEAIRETMPRSAAALQGVPLNADSDRWAGLSKVRFWWLDCRPENAYDVHGDFDQIVSLGVAEPVGWRVPVSSQGVVHGAIKLRPALALQGQTAARYFDIRRRRSIC